MNQLFSHFGGRMITAAVIQKLLAVIGREREYAVVPQTRFAQHVNQAAYLRIHPADG